MTARNDLESRRQALVQRMIDASTDSDHPRNSDYSPQLAGLPRARAMLAVERATGSLVAAGYPAEADNTTPPRLPNWQTNRQALTAAAQAEVAKHRTAVEAQQTAAGAAGRVASAEPCPCGAPTAAAEQGSGSTGRARRTRRVTSALTPLPPGASRADRARALLAARAGQPEPLVTPNEPSKPRPEDAPLTISPDLFEALLELQATADAGDNAALRRAAQDTVRAFLAVGA